MPKCKKHGNYGRACEDCEKEKWHDILYAAGATREAAAKTIAHHLVQNNLAAAHDLLNRLGHGAVNKTTSDNKIEIIIRDLKAERRANKDSE